MVVLREHGFAGQMDRQTVEKSHFGGFGDEDEDEDGVRIHACAYIRRMLIHCLACTKKVEI